MTKWSFEGLYEDFIDLETDLKLLDRTIDDVHFWERVRFRIHQRLTEELLKTRRGGKDSDGISEYLAGGQLFLQNIFIRNPYLAPEREYVFYSTGRRKQFDDGDWWDIYIDPIIDRLDNSYEFFERPYDVSHRTPPRTENLRYTDLVEYAGTLCERLGVRTVSLSTVERDLLKQVADEIDSRYGVSLPITNIVKRDLSRRRVRLPLFRRLIRRTSPELAFLITSYYGRETFVEACQLQDVPVIELQHGTITKYHLGYSYPNGEKRVFPDYFFAFGEFWGDTVDLPLPEENVYSVGYPFLEREAKAYENLETKDQVVFISQSVIGEELSRFAVELAESNYRDHRIIYKLHPKEYKSWEEEYPWLQSADLDIVTDSPELYQIFAESTAQIGVYSTALFEGLYFGLDTYVVDLPGYEYMDPLIETKCAKRISKPEDYLADDGTTVKSFDEEYFFEPDPLRNFEQYVTDIKRR